MGFVRPVDGFGRWVLLPTQAPKHPGRRSRRSMSGVIPFWEFAVRMAKSVLALLSVIARISVATRRFVPSHRI